MLACFSLRPALFDVKRAALCDAPNRQYLNLRGLAGFLMMTRRIGIKYAFIFSFLAAWPAVREAAELQTMIFSPSHARTDHRPDQLSWRERLSTMGQRMRHDLQLAIITLYSLCVLVFIGPFAVYRLTHGDIVIGLADSLLLVCFLALAALAWNPRWTRLLANVLAAVAALGVVAVTMLLDLSPMWVFSTLVGNFLMAERRVALAVNSSMVIILAVQPHLFQNSAEHATFVSVVSMTSLFSLIFASRVRTQRAQLHELAARDGLTGAYNRRSLDNDLTQLIDTGSQQTHSLAMIDLDNFKQLNDVLGHEHGDLMLKLLCQAAMDGTRGGDRFYRYGGEEFVLLLPETSLAGAEVALENLSQQFKQVQPANDQPVSFSAGLAEYTPGESRDAWLSRADSALRQAKRDGKDCYRQSSRSRTIE